MLIYCDGLTEPENNGGPNSKGSWAFLVLDDLSEPVAEIHRAAGYEGPNSTNNQMEYFAVGHACRWAVDNVKGRETINLLTDSQLVVKQANGEWNINKPHLRILCNRIIELQMQYARGGGEILIGWVPGAENKADELTREIYQKHTGVYPQPRVKYK